MEENRNKASFFRHVECEYFPCHVTEHPEDFNCLFCYCPLYMLGKSCGGSFRYTKRGIKDCSLCLKPHMRDSAQMVRARFAEIAARAKSE